MKIKKFLKPNILVPVLAGLTVGSVFFIWNEIDNTPWLSLIAILLCIALLYVGTHHAGKIDKKAKPVIVLPLLFGATGFVWISKYLIAGVYDEPPGLILGGLVISIVLLCTGFICLKKESSRKRCESNAA